MVKKAWIVTLVCLPVFMEVKRDISDVGVVVEQGMVEQGIWQRFLFSSLVHGADYAYFLVVFSLLVKMGCESRLVLSLPWKYTREMFLL